MQNTEHVLTDGQTVIWL